MVVLHDTHVVPVLRQDLRREGGADARAAGAELGCAVQVHLLVVDPGRDRKAHGVDAIDIVACNDVARHGSRYGTRIRHILIVILHR